MGDPITSTGGGTPTVGPGPGGTPPPPAAPVTIESDHCIESSITDLTDLSRTLAGNPCGSVMSQMAKWRW